MKRSEFFHIKKTYRVLVTSPNKNDYSICASLSHNNFDDLNSANQVMSVIHVLRNDLCLSVYAECKLLDCHDSTRFSAAANSMDDALKMLFHIIPTSYIPMIRKNEK